VDVGRPVSYLAAFVPPEAHARFIDSGITSYQHDLPMGKKATHMMRTNTGPIIALLKSDILEHFLDFVPIRGMTLRAETCRTIQSNLDLPLNDPIYACEVFPNSRLLRD
jgi:hypothetical protein